jgi:hypothetical protein
MDVKLYHFLYQLSFYKGGGTGGTITQIFQQWWNFNFCERTGLMCYAERTQDRLTGTFFNGMPLE